MTLEQILPELRKGRRAKRKGWGNLYFSTSPLTHEDLFADDWELEFQPIVIWVNVHDNKFGKVFASKENAEIWLTPGGRTVKFREVMDE